MPRQILPDDTQRDSVLTQIHEGMDVYNYNEDRIGTVERVFFGSVNEREAETGIGAATADPVGTRDRTWIEALADVFDTDDIPNELRERLQRQGFIRIDSSGLFSHDRYATPDQIAAVHQDRVILRSDKDGLIKK